MLHDSWTHCPTVCCSWGGEFARSVRRRGELVLAFQYVNTEPAMVIWSGTRQTGGWMSQTLSVDLEKTSELKLAGVLTGDVDGSWAALNLTQYGVY